MSDRKLNQPSLEALSFILRNKELWPAHFVWDFSACDQCAMGLAHKIWPDKIKCPSGSDMSEVFNLDKDAVTRIFMACTTQSLFKTISPEMVADRIDALNA